MSWQNELYKVYERQCSEGGAIAMLPMSHSTANAQVEVVVDEEGNFVSARKVDKEEAVTIIPVTEDSGTRSSGICPMPLADKLVYIAGDYGQYAQGNREDNSKHFAAYINQLMNWSESEYTHPAVVAIYKYLSKAEIMHDLIMSGVLQLDDATGRLRDKVNIANIAQEDAFVRFRIIYYDLDIERTEKTWKDQSLYESFIAYNRSIMKNVQLCYATGQELPVTYKHPSKIRNSGDKGKLISSNDESGFAYRGRFSNKEEALSISYEFSQKMHSALKGLIASHGMFFDSLTLVLWEENLSEVPDIRNSAMRLGGKADVSEEESGEEVVATEEQYVALLKKMIFGYRDKLGVDAKIMLLGIDAATTGRLSISLYSELMGSVFYENLEKWHREIAGIRFDPKAKHNIIDSFSVYDIVDCAYGTEHGSAIESDKKLRAKAIIRLLPCIIEGKAVPNDITNNLCTKASNPLAYNEAYNHRRVLETACGMIRKMNIERKKGVVKLAYDPTVTSRSYLYGCLLALADKTESDTFAKEEKGKRQTNARRYWNAFSARPYHTWQVINEKLIPYLNKLGAYSAGYEKRFQEIMGKMTYADFVNNQALSPDYLLGYHHYMAYLYDNSKKEEQKDEHTTEQN